MYSPLFCIHLPNTFHVCSPHHVSTVPIHPSTPSILLHPPCMSPSPCFHFLTPSVMCDQVTCVINYVHPDIVMLKLRFDGCYMCMQLRMVPVVLSCMVYCTVLWYNIFCGIIHLYYGICLILWFHEYSSPVIYHHT